MSSQPSLYLYIPNDKGAGTPYRVEILKPQDPTVTRLIRLWKKSAEDGKVGKKYDLHEGPFGWECSCPSWNFSKADPKSCKHLSAIFKVRLV